MKKVLSLLLALSLVAVLAVGCSNDTDVDPDPDPEVGAVEFGLGVVNSIGKSRDLGTNAAGETVLPRAQVDTTFAAVSFDADGKVVAVHIDVAQARVNYDADMKVSDDKSVNLKTKKDLGTAYNMKGASAIGKEWFEQMKALEEWMVGKTITEIKALPTKEVDPTHLFVPDVPELTSTVTITVESYLAAVEAAWNNRQAAEGIETLGLGYEISIGKSRDLGTNAAGETVLPRAQVDTTMAATAFDADGKVVGTQIDNAQVRVNYDADGIVTDDKSAKPKTKKELGNDYGMKRVSNIGKEWFEQMAAFEEWMEGKTISEIKALTTKEVDPTHLFVPDVPELTSTVTITVESYLAVVEKAFATKK